MKKDKRLQLIHRSWQQAGLENDFIFNKVMLDEQLTREVLRRILPTLNITKIKLLNHQQEFSASFDAKGVRLDIYAEDEQNNRYDIEMQVVNKHNLPMRIRFYQSNLAIDCYEKGENYDQADNSFVIFFCCFDPFDLNEQAYEVRRMIKNHQEKDFNDGETSLFFDVNSLRHDVNPLLQQFLDVIANRKLEQEDDFIVQLKKRIRMIKHNRKWRNEFMQRSLFEMDHEIDLRQAEQRGLEEGIEKGIGEGIRGLVESLRKYGIPEADIQQEIITHYHVSADEARRFLQNKKA